MTVSHSPAPARSDVASATPGPAPRPFLTHGRMLTVGALAWSASILLVGQDPHDPLGLAVFGIGSGLFQVGLLFLLRVLWRTRALGEGRIARTVLRIETVVVGLAMASTLADTLAVSDLGQTGWLLLDLCWPLSMLGMFFIGIRIAIAGRWTGLSRFWPMVAESWAVVTVPALMLGGALAGQLVGALHLVVGYAVLGVLVARKQG
ncbi:hypothetical protein [Nocardioides euryhalodurans]|uniref:Uncharacterized protein n=1 Tax=Nocardioides euryhalodurans TaxID=2518370 RepID=A0A4P7GHB7_9ACTN|nr:hypothetical protein [Nocardioides euryhalodurans]QBR91057.1 hypothetical protein EXE57_01315 [Nocardioides euryhalodurans]